jgi:hypothetical protein
VQPARAFLNARYPDIGSEAVQLGYFFEVYAAFLNLCEDLKNLAQSDPEMSQDAWDKLLTELQKIVKNDFSTDFIAPTILALAELCCGANPPASVSGPDPALPAGSSYAVTLTYA